jgi:hypothetical protein
MISAPPKPLISPGTRVRIAQHVRVGDKRWTTYVTGVVEDGGTRPVGGMEMGVKANFCFQPTLRLRLDDGEITILAVDENTEYEVLASPAAPPRGAS